MGYWVRSSERVRRRVRCSYQSDWINRDPAREGQAGNLVESSAECIKATVHGVSFGSCSGLHLHLCFPVAGLAHTF